MDALISAGATALLDAVGDGITIQNPAGQVIYANPAAAHALGFATPAEFLATPPGEIMKRFELFDEFGRPLGVDALPGRGALAGEPENERTLQFRIIATDEMRWSIIKAQPVFNSDGTVRFAVNIWHDITERVSRQRSLEEASVQLEETAAELEATVSELEVRTEEAESRANRHKFLAEAGRMLASSLDVEDTLRMIMHLAVPRLADWADVSLLMADGKLERLETAHQDPEKLKYVMELDRRFPRDPQTDSAYRVARTGASEIYPQIPDELLRSAAQSPEHYMVLRELDLRSGMVVPMKVREQILGVITFVRTSDSKPYNYEDLEFAESLAARSALALSNARLYREAQEANRAKSDFLAVMSHELRTPLTAIFGYTELLSTGVAGDITDAQAAHLERIHASAAHLLTIIEDVLSYARTEAGKDQLHEDSVRVRDVIAEAVMMVRPSAEKKSLQILTDVKEDVAIKTDRAKLRQILINLIGNAVKFTDTGSVSIGAAHTDRHVTITVSDTGIGIRDEDQTRIFEPFRQLEPSMTRKAGGTGLGLAVCNRFAALMGGRIEVQSKPGKGSTFTLTLPLSPTP
jgi:signal transduction histidine kinase